MVDTITLMSTNTRIKIVALAVATIIANVIAVAIATAMIKTPQTHPVDAAAAVKTS